MTEQEAYEAYCQQRWPNGEPVCPRCGSLEAYSITTRRKFKCKGCGHQFSVTSGTVFASRKLPFAKLLELAGRGGSPSTTAREVGVNYRTAWRHSRAKHPTQP